MANYENTRYDFNGANLTGIQGVNTGLIIPWGSASIPSGFLECDGTAVSRSTYAALFAIVGTNYGVGDGSTTFNLPDLSDRVCQNKSPSKAQFSTGGTDTIADSGSLSGISIGNTTLDTNTIPSHSHTFSGTGPSGACSQGNNTNGSSLGNNPTTSTGGGGAHSHSDGDLAFTGDSNSVLQPYLTLVYIIKT
jgi:microcystin-dependent protein